MDEQIKRIRMVCNFLNALIIMSDVSIKSMTGTQRQCDVVRIIIELCIDHFRT